VSHFAGELTRQALASFVYKGDNSIRHFPPDREAAGVSGPWAPDRRNFGLAGRGT